MPRSFDVELMDTMLSKPFLPAGLIDQLRKAKSDIEKFETPVRNELLAAATVAIRDVINAVDGHPAERTEAR